MTYEEFKAQFEQLIKQDALAEAAAFLADNVEQLPADQQTSPFSARVRLTVDNEADQLEGDIAIGFVTGLSRMLRNAEYFSAIRKNPEKLRIVEEGDSWHQYPVFLDDLIDHVAEHFPVFSLSAPGDTAEKMALGSEHVGAIIKHQPDVFMLSAGGNDLLGEGRFKNLLRNYRPGATAAELINTNAMNSALGAVLGHFQTIITSALAAKADLTVFLHGYANVHPQDGGKWMGQPLAQKGIPLSLGREITSIILDHFNARLHSLANGSHGRVVYFDLRGLVGKSANSWHDELHPKSPGFGRAAAPIIEALETHMLGNGALEATDTTFASYMPIHTSTRAAIMAAKQTPPHMDCDNMDPVFGHEVSAAHSDLQSLLDELNTPEDPARISARRRYSLSPNPHPYERIIGESNLDEFYVLSRGVSAGRAVARIHARGPVEGASFGTGFLIGNGLLITNNHVIGARETAQNSVATFNYEYDDDGMIRPSVHFRLTGDIFLTSVEMDYTIMSVSPVSTAGEALEQFGYIKMLPRSGKALKKEFVNIIQHPGGNYKKVALRENMVVGTRQHYLYYVTDTMPGSSGAPVLNEEWQLAALHHMAIPDPNDPHKYIANRGIRISAILDDVGRQRNNGSADAARIDERLQLTWRLETDIAPKALGPIESAAVGVSHPTAAPVDIDDDVGWAEALDEPDAAQFEAVRPRLKPSDAYWPKSPQNAPDTWHLPAQTATGQFDLDAGLIANLIATSHFAPQMGSHGKLILALRGCQIADGSAMAERQTNITLRPALPDHEHTRCLIGVYDSQSGLISLYDGSTVPRRTGMNRYYERENFAAKHARCNLLPTGCYEYCVGTHIGERAGAVEFVLRLGNGPLPANASTVTVLRTTNDLAYGTHDIWDMTKPSDNIHPAFLSTSFSSIGCLTVPGKQAGHGASFTTGTGAWRRFRKSAGFDGTGFGSRYDALLVTGHEAASIAAGQGVACLRHGSSGAAVADMQTQIGATADGDFGAKTKLTLCELQQDKLGFATGTFSPAMAEKLGLEFRSAPV